MRPLNRIACVLAPSLATVIGPTSPSWGQGAMFYVRTSGSDSANGLSAATAFRTVQKAVQSCSGVLGGYTIHVGPGTYSETVAITSVSGAASGVAASPNRIVGDITGAHTGDTGGPVVISGGGTRGYGIQVHSRSHWAFSNLTIRDQTWYGIHISSGRGYSITDCSIRPSGYFGIYASASDITIDRNEFPRGPTTGSCVAVVADGAGYINARRNRYVMTGADYQSRRFAQGISWGSLWDRDGFLQNITQTFLYGICVFGEWGKANVITIENNVGSDCFLGVYASAVASSGARIDIASNTMTGCVYPIYFTALFTGAVTARNNIVADSYYPISAFAPSGRIEGVLSHRITTSSFLSSGVQSVTGSITGDPRFRSPLTGDFSLLAGSPALDAGVADSSVAEDIMGNLRPTDGNHDGTIAMDLGAYECTPRRRWRVTRAQESRPPLATVKLGTARQSTQVAPTTSTTATTVAGDPISSLLRQLFPGN